MTLDGVLGDAEPLSDVTIAQSFSDQSGDFVLTRRKPEHIELFACGIAPAAGLDQHEQIFAVSAAHQARATD